MTIPPLREVVRAEYSAILNQLTRAEAVIDAAREVVPDVEIELLGQLTLHMLIVAYDDDYPKAAAEEVKAGPNGTE